MTTKSDSGSPKTNYGSVELNDKSKKEDSGDSKKEELEDLGGMMRISSEYGRGHRCYLFWGIIGAGLNGAMFPLWGLLFREITDVLFYTPKDELSEEAFWIMIYFIALGLGAFIFTIMQFVFWGYYGAHIGVAVRKDYFWILMQQEVGYHDIENSGTLNTEMIADCLFITEGMGIKTGFLLQQITQFLVGFFLAFWYSWEMSLVLLATLPVLILVGFIQGKVFAGAG
eukprot:102084_1